MNSFRVLAGGRQPPLTADFAQELLSGVGPLDRLSPSVALGEEAENALADVVGALKVVGRQRLPLPLAEHDLDLVEPGGVDGQPMEVDGKRQAPAREPARQTLGRMRRAVVQDEVQAADPSAPDTAEEQREEALELDEALALEAARQRFPGMHEQAAEQLHRPLALVAIRQVHRPAGARRRRAPAGAAGPGSTSSHPRKRGCVSSGPSA